MYYLQNVSYDNAKPLSNTWLIGPIMLQYWEGKLSAILFPSPNNTTDEYCNKVSID